MDKNTLDRLRQLAGNAPAKQYATEHATQNMYQIRDRLVESSAVAEKTTKWKKAPSKNGKYYAEKDGESKGFTSNLKRDEFIRKQNSSVTESSAIDRARFDAASDDKKKVSLKPAPWEKDKKEVKESEDDDEVTDDDEEYERGVAKARRRNPDFANEAKTEADMMREWSNSVYQNYEDVGNIQEQPEGETVDLSLRRYLNAQPQKVTTVSEDIKPEALLREYRDFKKAKPKGKK